MQAKNNNQQAYLSIYLSIISQVRKEKCTCKISSLCQSLNEAVILSTQPASISGLEPCYQIERVLVRERARRRRRRRRVLPNKIKLVGYLSICCDIWVRFLAAPSSVCFLMLTLRASMQTLSMLWASSKTTTHSFCISLEMKLATLGSSRYW